MDFEGNDICSNNNYEISVDRDKLMHPKLIASER